MTRAAVTAILAGGGVVAGASAFMLLIGLTTRVNPVEHPSAYGVAALFGGLFGLVAAPLGGWMFFRSAPIGLAALSMATGTVVGGVLGDWLLPFSPQAHNGPPGVAIGGVTGFALGALAVLILTRHRRNDARHVG